jgi:hypothetical protein
MYDTTNASGGVEPNAVRLLARHQEGNTLPERSAEA